MTTTEITLAEYRALQRKTPKYGNKRDDVFDSKAEAARYKELCLLVAAGTITDLEIHPVYELQPAFKCNGKTYRAVTYEADFCYIGDDKTIVEDVKGVITDTFRIKEKLFRFRYPDIDFRIIDA